MRQPIQEGAEAEGRVVENRHAQGRGSSETQSDSEYCGEFAGSPEFDLSAAAGAANAAVAAKVPLDEGAATPGDSRGMGSNARTRRGCDRLQHETGCERIESKRSEC